MPRDLFEAAVDLAVEQRQLRAQCLTCGAHLALPDLKADACWVCGPFDRDKDVAFFANDD